MISAVIRYLVTLGILGVLSGCGSLEMMKTIPYLERQHVLHVQPRVGDSAIYAPLTREMQGEVPPFQVTVSAIRGGETLLTRQTLQEGAMGEMLTEYTLGTEGVITGAVLRERAGAPGYPLALFGTRNPNDKLLFWLREKLPEPKPITVPAGTFMVTEIIQFGMRQDQGILGKWEAVHRDFMSPDVPFGLVMRVTETVGEAKMLQLLNAAAQGVMGTVDGAFSPSDAYNVMREYDRNGLQKYETVWGLAQVTWAPR